VKEETAIRTYSSSCLDQIQCLQDCFPPKIIRTAAAVVQGNPMSRMVTNEGRQEITITEQGSLGIMAQEKPNFHKPLYRKWDNLFHDLGHELIDPSYR
jgi:hypothetical protein